MAQKIGPRTEVRGSLSLRARAMRFLARREHSRAELKRKLAPSVGEADDLEILLDDLARGGWLSDARFAELSIRSKARRFGPLKLAQELRGKGVDAEAIAAGFRAAGADGASSLQRVWASRFGTPPAGERERARHVRFLQGRGFPFDDILRFLKQLEKIT
ncbi:MAG TPA: recombination regulator RecX [Usitatibacter sp.]|nr:recombination regulator RecX [Usitatibacter sp.]